MALPVKTIAKDALSSLNPFARAPMAPQVPCPTPPSSGWGTLTVLASGAAGFALGFFFGRKKS